VAHDGAGNNSVFTTALLDNIDTTGLDVRLMLGRVRQKVVLDTFGRQVSWVEEALIGEHVLSSARDTIGPADEVTEEVRVWRASCAAGDGAAMGADLDGNPQGMFADLARERLSVRVSANANTRGINLASEDLVALAAALAVVGFPVEPEDRGLSDAVGLCLAQHPELDGQDLRPLYDEAAANAMILAAATAQRLRTDLVALRSVDRLKNVSLDALSRIEAIAEDNPVAASILEQAQRVVYDVELSRERILERLDQSRSQNKEIIDKTAVFCRATRPSTSSPVPMRAFRRAPSICASVTTRHFTSDTSERLTHHTKEVKHG
jgi:hypothetical protein